MTSAYNYFREIRDPVRTLVLRSERTTELRRLFLKHSVFNAHSRKWEHDYKLQYKGKTYPVCETVFANIHGFTKSAFEKEANDIKKGIIHEEIEDVTNDYDKTLRDEGIVMPYTDSTLHPFSAIETSDFIEENVVGTINVPEVTLRAMTPLADRQAFCVQWLDTYFKTFADSSPNSLFSKVSLTFKKDLYELYVAQVKSVSPIVTYARFLQLWTVLFPYCLNRPWCNVPGKCPTCFIIQEARTNLRQDHLTAKMLQQCHAIHRGGLFMLERAKYKERVLLATSNKQTKMSIIIDGMDQSHCQVPYFGQTHTFADPITQHITGVKEHGHGITIYRTLGTVNKGANLTIYCILSQIEAWKKRNNNCYPEELFLQVDGGSENANKFLLGMLEFLVYKRLIKTIHFNRLPTGHTHEDIGIFIFVFSLYFLVLIPFKYISDAVFAVIWKALRRTSVLTLDAYEESLQGLFSDDKYKLITVETPMLIPEYDAWLLPALDSKISRLHHEMQTQHAWRFEAVEKSLHFPTGVKTCYKAYSSDVVVEIRKISKQEAQTPIGKHTGLEAFKVLLFYILFLIIFLMLCVFVGVQYLDAGTSGKESES